MKKQNFTESEISKIVVALGPKFSVRLNRGGNITVCNPFIAHMPPKSLGQFEIIFAKLKVSTLFIAS